MMPLIDTVRKAVPFPVRQHIKHLLFPILECRHRNSRTFWETYSFLQESQWWPKDRLLEYQVQKLQDLVRQAALHVPYYRKIFGEYGIVADNVRSLADLTKLPYLTKEAVKRHNAELIAENVPRSALSLVHTSGTTGKPLQWCEDKGLPEKERAYIYHQWSRVGVRPGDRIVQLRGAIIDSGKQVLPAERILRLSPKIDTIGAVKRYSEEIHKFDARYLHGYPSAIATFAHFIIQHGMPVPFRLKAVLFASESVYQWQRSLVEKAFGCRVFSHYGMSERTVLGAECECAETIHCLPQYSITEVDPESHEIIGTSLLNFAFPFIRYRTTDSAECSADEACDCCGRHCFPMLKSIEGRLEDFIVTPDGTLISPAVVTHPFKDLHAIKHTQIIQTDVHRIMIKIVPWEGIDDSTVLVEAKQLRHDLALLFGMDMVIEMEVVTEIPLLKSGKFKWIISEVSRDTLTKGLS